MLIIPIAACQLLSQAFPFRELIPLALSPWGYKSHHGTGWHTSPSQIDCFDSSRRPLFILDRCVQEFIYLKRQSGTKSAFLVWSVDCSEMAKRLVSDPVHQDHCTLANVTGMDVMVCHLPDGVQHAM